MKDQEKLDAALEVAEKIAKELKDLDPKVAASACLIATVAIFHKAGFNSNTFEFFVSSMHRVYIEMVAEDAGRALILAKALQVNVQEQRFKN